MQHSTGPTTGHSARYLSSNNLKRDDRKSPAGRKRYLQWKTLFVWAWIIRMKSTCNDCILAQDIFFYQLDKITLFKLKSPILHQTKFWCAEKYNLNLALFYCQLSAQIEGGWQQFAALSTTYVLMGHHNNLSVDAKIMVSIGCPIIGEHIVIIFMTK